MSIRLKFILFFVSILLIPINLDVFGLEQTPRDVGFANKYVINVDENYFNVNVNANFLISSHTFNANESVLHFDIVSNFDYDNIGEFMIPPELMNGEFIVLLDDEEISYQITKTSNFFVLSIEFEEKGERTIDITTTKNSSGGCLIATATFGSELTPQVQLLRELRDNIVLQTESGTSFMILFNQFYYSFSPAIADYERENLAFKESVKITLTPLLTSLTLLQYADIDSESEMLGYGIGIILLNIGMYFIAPAIIIMKIRKRVNIEKLDEKYV